MRGKKLFCIAICVCLCLILLSGCSGVSKEVPQALSDYLTHIDAGEYKEAYALISDFDKGNISEELFVKWQEQVAKIAKSTGFTIDGKIDVFKDYKYLGTEFGTAYGLKVDRKQEMLIPQIELTGYDAATFRIMVVQQKDGCRVLLLLTNLNETVAVHEAYLKEYQ
jgi:hypothetical protein